MFSKHRSKTPPPKKKTPYDPFLWIEFNCVEAFTLFATRSSGFSANHLIILGRMKESLKLALEQPSGFESKA